MLVCKVLLFISGVNGTGKSFLIETIKHQVTKIWENESSGDSKCVVTAPTGFAAYKEIFSNCHQ